MGDKDDGESQSQAIMAIVLVARKEGLLDEAPKKPAKQRRPQILTWDDLPSDVDFGWVMNQAPPVTVVEGNRAGVPIYTPALNARIPDFGDHTLMVTVPGNDEFEEATLYKPLHVRRLKLEVKAPRLYKESGKPLPDLSPVVTGRLRPGDRMVATTECEARADSPENLDGYPVLVKLDWQQGKASNYDLFVANGWLKVRPGWDEMEQRIKQLRARALKLPKDRQKALGPGFDDVRDSRLKGEKPDLDGEAENLRQLTIDLDEQEYFKVTGVSFAPHAGTIQALETLQLTAAVEPKNASNPALIWTVDLPELATVSADGTVKRVGQPGGEVTVTATSACRDGIIKSTKIKIRPRPLVVEVIAPEQLFLGETVQLTARVLPPEADQAVTWKRTGTWKKNSKMTASGSLTIDAPSTSGGSAQGSCSLLALAAADPAIESEEADIPFGGKRSTAVRLLPSKRTVELGERVALSAEVTPPEAAQLVTWSVDDDSIAHLEGADDASSEAVLVMDKAGTVKVRGTTTDGSGVDAEIKINVKVHLTAFDVTVPRTQIGIVDRLVLTPVFTPSEGACRVEWSVADSDKDAPARVEKNVLYPLGAGTVTLCATVPDTGFKKDLLITVVAAPTMAVDANSWDCIRPLIGKFAEKIKITENENCNAKFGKWLYALGEEITRRAGSRTLQALKNEMIALRNEEYRLLHEDWLAEAGFAWGSSNCMIRNNATLDERKVHLTMFPTAATIEIGNNYAALENKIYRKNVTGRVSMHATLYVNPSMKLDECKAYFSGEDWTPVTQVIERMGGYAKYNVTKSRLETWLTNNVIDARTALQDLFNDIRVNDGGHIA